MYIYGERGLGSEFESPWRNKHTYLSLILFILHIFHPGKIFFRGIKVNNFFKSIVFTVYEILYVCTYI